MAKRKECKLRDIVSAWRDVRATPARLEKRARLRTLFTGLNAQDLALAASYLAGEIPQGSLQVGWSMLLRAERDAGERKSLPLFDPQETGGPAKGAVPESHGGRDPETPRGESPTLVELEQTFASIQRVAGPRATVQRENLLRGLLEPRTAEEKRFLRGLLLGELRQGALRAVVLEAVAEAFTIDPEILRRAVMFSGSLGAALQKVVREGVEGLLHLGPRPGVPVEPMLAVQAEDLDTALADSTGPLAVEWKLDGVRIQLHKAGRKVHVFSRQLRDVTDLAPEAAQLARALSAQSVILDGELIALNAKGRPVPFQDLMSRFSGSKKKIRPVSGRGGDLFGSGEAAPGISQAPDAIARVVPLFFDVLEWNGQSQVDRPYEERRALLEELLPESSRVPQALVRDAKGARAVYEAALAAGHEGVLLKNLESPYTAGRRGAAWRKLKPAITLDLVILAAEWGHGRRQGFLSNLHLGVRDPEDPGLFHMLGKTFKGLTDEMLREQTGDLLALEVRREGHVVFVRPERVVEVAFDGVQRSRRYSSGFALRFARVKRFRPDKSSAEASTLDEVRSRYDAQH